MAITTKKGDRGITSLYPKKRVYKDDIRLEIVGTFDELCSYMGMLRSKLKDRWLVSLIRKIQEDLMTICCEIASVEINRGYLKRMIEQRSVEYIEDAILFLEKSLKLKAGYFCLPGEGFESSLADIARAIARRAERRLVSLGKKGKISNVYIQPYINRLSDLLYLVARRLEVRHRYYK